MHFLMEQLSLQLIVLTESIFLKCCKIGNGLDEPSRLFYPSRPIGFAPAGVAG